jgi:hypothetical protein
MEINFLTFTLGGILFFVWSALAFGLGVWGGRESARQEYYRRMDHVNKN